MEKGIASWVEANRQALNKEKIEYKEKKKLSSIELMEIEADRYSLIDEIEKSKNIIYKILLKYQDKNLSDALVMLDGALSSCNRCSIHSKN